jgi:hypothetical protein
MEWLAEDVEMLADDRVAVALALLALVFSIRAVQVNYNTTRVTGRMSFALWLVAISIVPAALVSNDLVRFSGGQFERFLPSILYIAWAALAWPFYTHLCRRLRDARLSRHLAIVGLVPYLNYLLFVFLCFMPTRPSAGA